MSLGDVPDHLCIQPDWVEVFIPETSRTQFTGFESLLSQCSCCLAQGRPNPARSK